METHSVSVQRTKRGVPRSARPKIRKIVGISIGPASFALAETPLDSPRVARRELCALQTLPRLADRRFSRPWLRSRLRLVHFETPPLPPRHLPLLAQTSARYGLGPNRCRRGLRRVLAP